MSKVPNVNTVCEGMGLTATLVTPGSGGVTCEDIFVYRTNNGTGYELGKTIYQVRQLHQLAYPKFK